MRKAQGASVRLRVAPTKRGIEIEFVATRRRVRSVRVTLPDLGRIGEVRHELDQGLTRVKEVVTAMRVADVQLSEIADALGSMGRRMVLILFENAPNVIQELQTFWNAAIPAWRNGAYIPIVECLGDEDHLIPLEFLPLFDMAGCDQNISGRADFVRACRSFVGFSCVVRRHILPMPVVEGNDIVAESDGRLVLRYLHDENLPGAKVERQWLTSNAAARVLLLGPYPDKEQTTADLAAQIFDPSKTSTYPHPDNIQHFSCHCDTTPKRPLDYEIRLFDTGRELRTTLGELGDLLVQQAATEPRGEQSMPLVVLNACGSSKVDALSSMSFPKLFLKNGNRGFLGAEIAVPDEEAAEFSIAFYRSLLMLQEPFGLAAHRARTHLLEEFGNPIGIAYSVYGNTDLVVTQQEAGA